MVSNTWIHHWAYWAGPMLAAVIAGVLYKAVFLSAPITKKQAEQLGLFDADATMGSLPRPVVNKRITEAEMIGRQAADASALEEIVVHPRQSSELKPTRQSSQIQPTLPTQQVVPVPTHNRRTSIPPVKIIPPPRQPTMQAVMQGVDRSSIDFQRTKAQFKAQMTGVDETPNSVRASAEEIYRHYGV